MLALNYVGKEIFLLQFLKICKNAQNYPPLKNNIMYGVKKTLDVNAGAI